MNSPFTHAREHITRGVPHIESHVVTSARLTLIGFGGYERQPLSIGGPHCGPRAARVHITTREISFGAAPPIDQPHIPAFHVVAQLTTIGRSRAGDSHRDPLPVRREGAWPKDA